MTLFLGLNTCSQKVSRKASRSQSSWHSDSFISRVLSSVEERSAFLFNIDYREHTTRADYNWWQGGDFIHLFSRRMAFSPSPLTLLMTCSLFCELGATGPPLNPRAQDSHGWHCSAWPQWSTSCIPAVLRSGRWRSRRSWRATSSFSTGTVHSSVSS